MISSKNFEERMKKKRERWCSGGAIHHKRRVGGARAPPKGDKGRGNMETVLSTGSNRDGKGSPAGTVLP